MKIKFIIETFTCSLMFLKTWTKSKILNWFEKIWINVFENPHKNGQFTEKNRKYVKNGHEIIKWKSLLFRKFKKIQFSTFKTLKFEQYTTENASNDREISEFIIKIVRHAKNAKISDVSVQFNFVWNKFNANFRKFIRKSSFYITVFQFIEKIEKLKKIWHDKYARREFKINQKRQQNTYMSWNLLEISSHLSCPQHFDMRLAPSFPLPWS